MRMMPKSPFVVETKHFFCHLYFLYLHIHISKFQVIESSGFGADKFTMVRNNDGTGSLKVRIDGDAPHLAIIIRTKERS